MSFTSPIFLFAFLPLALLIYSVTPDNAKKYVFIFINTEFFLLANASEPISIFIVIVIIILTYLGGKIIRISASKKISAVFCFFEIIALTVYKYLCFNNDSFNVYSIGISFGVLASVSYLIDVGRKDADINASIFDVALYVSFFPTAMAGPLVKYKEFVHIFEHRTQSVKIFSNGAILFSVGFIKKIMIAQSVHSIINSISQSEVMKNNIFVIIIDFVLFFIAALFEIWGYSDMGCGIASMFGYTLPDNFGYFINSYTVTGFFNNFFISVKKWVTDYLYNPLCRKKDGKGKMFFVPLLVSSVISSIFIKPTAFMVLFGTVISLVLYAENKFSITEKAAKNKIAKTFSIIISTVIVCFAFSFIRVDSISSLIENVQKIRIDTFDFVSLVTYVGIIGLKSVFVAFVILILIYKKKLELNKNNGVAKKYDNIIKVSFDVVILILFVFSVIYFLPQYPECAKAAFDLMIL